MKLDLVLWHQVIKTQTILFLFAGTYANKYHNNICTFTILRLGLQDKTCATWAI